MVYCVRSFVPILKKSASFASRSAMRLAAGVSIIAPTWISLLYAIFSASSSAISSFTRAFTLLISSTHVTSGTMILISPNALARRSALSCTLYESLFCRQYLTALKPKNGLSSFSSPRYGMSLSPPTSRVLMITSLPSMVSAAALYAWNCSSSDGSSDAPMNRNSVLKRPTPSPSHAATCFASSGLPILPYKCTFTPSAVTVFLPLYTSRRALSLRYFSLFA